MCPECGGKTDEYVFVFRPDRGQEIVAGVRAEFPNVDFSITTIEGQKIKIILRQFLTPVQKTKMNNYFTNMGYIEDLEAESMERELRPMGHEVYRAGTKEKAGSKQKKK